MAPRASRNVREVVARAVADPAAVVRGPGRAEGRRHRADPSLAGNHRHQRAVAGEHGDHAAQP